MVRLHIADKKGISTFSVDAKSGAVKEEEKGAWEKYAARFTDEQRRAFELDLLNPKPLPSTPRVTQGVAIMDKEGNVVKRVRK